MFQFDNSPLPIPDDLPGLLASVWEDLSAPGSGWSGSERVALASVSRMARSGSATGQTSLPHGAVRAAGMITTEPHLVTKQWVDRVVKDIGEPRYVELVGVVAAVTGVDIITQFLGAQTVPLPTPKPGRAVSNTNPNARMSKAWVKMEGPPLPRNALSAVPATQATANRLLDRLYMTREDHQDPGPIRGLSRVHLELVATVVSHGNYCFYCTMGHLIALRARAEEQGIEVDHRSIVDPDIDPGFVGGRELIDLGVESTRISPHPAVLVALAEVIGPVAAVTAMEVAAGFGMTNRIIEATGQPVLVNQRTQMLPLLQEIGADEFPHSGLTTERQKPGFTTKLRRKLSGK